MSNLAAWLVALVGPLAIKVMIALGFTVVAFSGVQLLVNQLIQMAQTNWSSMPYAVLQLASLSGIPEALGMIAGAYMSRVALWVTTNAAKYVVKP